MPPPLQAASFPAAAEFRMPAEWERHAATWLAWPHNADDWPGKFEVIPWVYAEMVRKIAAGEIVRLIVRHNKDKQFARHVLRQAGAHLKNIQFVVHPTDRGWTRDTGPVFVHWHQPGARGGDKSGTAIVHFNFNGWA